MLNELNKMILCEGTVAVYRRPILYFIRGSCALSYDKYKYKSNFN